MSTVAAPSARRAAGDARGHRSWGPARYLAALAVPLLAYELWTVGGWVIDGPFQITADRDRGSSSWYAARVLEVLIVVSVAGFVAKSVRDYRREGRLGIDALLIIGMASAAFWDPVYNWAVPAWLYSSHWLNVNDWFAHAPGVINPAAGTQPWPIVVVLIGYPLWGVGFAMLVCAGMTRVRRRWEGCRAGLLAAIGFALSVLLTVASFSVFKALELMSAPGLRFTMLGDSDIAFAGLSGGVVFWGLACLRYYRTSDGRALFEIGSRSRPTSVLAAIAAVQLIVVIGWGVMTVPFTPHASAYPELPAHLVNGVCDIPGASGSTYGPCPGSPGFRLPVK